jgi:hypothetical protein
MVQGGLGKKQDPNSKVTRKRRARGITQAVECKSKALSSNPSTTKNKIVKLRLKI